MVSRISVAGQAVLAATFNIPCTSTEVMLPHALVLSSYLKELHGTAIPLSAFILSASIPVCLHPCLPPSLSASIPVCLHPLTHPRQPLSAFIPPPSFCLPSHSTDPQSIPQPNGILHNGPHQRLLPYAAHLQVLPVFTGTFTSLCVCVLVCVCTCVCACVCVCLWL